MNGTFQMLGALGVTLGVMALAIAVLKRMQNAPGGKGRASLEVLQRMPLGPRQGVALVQVAERVLVLGLAENGVRLLTELTAEECAKSCAPEAPPSTRPVFKIPGLGRIGLFVLLLGLAAAPVRAQSGAAAPAPAKSSVVAPAKPPLTTPVAPVAPAPVASRAPVTASSPVGRAVPGFTVTGPAPPQVDVRIGEGKDALHLNGAVGLVIFLGVLTLLPALFLLMTSFTRILIVLHFLRSALGTQTTPPSQLLVAFAVLLTGVVMNPVIQETQKTALQPYLDGRLTQVQAYQEGVKPFREFMLSNTREQDLQLFTELSGITRVDSAEALPTVTIVSAFMTSELRTAFQMGFLIFLPFVVVDVIVASVLMSLGMFMLPPVMISLPFKLLLFVLADGWTLVVQNLVASFH